MCGRTRYANGCESAAVCPVAWGRNRHGVEAGWGGETMAPLSLFSKRSTFSTNSHSFVDITNIEKEWQQAGKARLWN